MFLEYLYSLFKLDHFQEKLLQRIKQFRMLIERVSFGLCMLTGLPLKAEERKSGLRMVWRLSRSRITSSVRKACEQPALPSPFSSNLIINYTNKIAILSHLPLPLLYPHFPCLSKLSILIVMFDQIRQLVYSDKIFDHPILGKVSCGAFSDTLK